MDRNAVTQIVVVLVLATLVARWIPAGPEELGFGDALVAWRTDAFLAANDDAALAKARLMYGRRQRPSLVRHWRTVLQQAAKLHQRATAGEDLTVQLAGVPRNDFWFLTYELLPIPVVGRPYEEGSRHDDPAVPGTTLFPLGITEDVELAEWDAELRSAEEQRRARREAAGGRRER